MCIRDRAADTPRLVSLLVVAIDADGEDLSFDGLGFDRGHPTWVGHVMSATPARRADHLQNMFAITIGANVSALELRNALFTGAVTNAAGELERVVALIGGLDGAAPVDVYKRQKFPRPIARFSLTPGKDLAHRARAGWGKSDPPGSLRTHCH